MRRALQDSVLSVVCTEHFRERADLEPGAVFVRCLLLACQQGMGSFVSQICSTT